MALNRSKETHGLLDWLSLCRRRKHEIKVALFYCFPVNILFSKPVIHSRRNNWVRQLVEKYDFWAGLKVVWNNLKIPWDDQLSKVRKFPLIWKCTEKIMEHYIYVFNGTVRWICICLKKVYYWIFVLVSNTMLHNNYCTIMVAIICWQYTNIRCKWSISETAV